MAYDHLFRAGNRADVFKHTALLAATRALLDDHPRRDFTYADAFAGYAASPMVRNYGWEDGARVLAQKIHAVKDGALRNQTKSEGTSASHDDLQVFTARHLASASLHDALQHDSTSASLVAGVWPGSSLVVFDACKAAGVACQLNLFDISLAVIANLRGVFREQECTVVGSPASPESPLVRGTDLLFIDPPGIRSPRDRSAPSWASVRALALADVKACILWLPVMGQDAPKNRDAPESEESAAWRADLVAEGWSAYRVLWQNSGSGMIGTQLIWRLPQHAGKRIETVTRQLCAMGLGWMDEHQAQG